MRKFTTALILCWFIVNTVMAEENEVSVATAYVQIKPSIVTNYGGVGKLRYFKSDISLRVISSNEERVRWHIPYIRSELVSLFSRQEEVALTTREGKDELRLQALGIIQGIMEEEEGEPLVEDLLFTNFVIQK